MALFELFLDWFYESILSMAQTAFRALYSVFQVANICSVDINRALYIECFYQIQPVREPFAHIGRSVFRTYLTAFMKTCLNTV